MNSTQLPDDPHDTTHSSDYPPLAEDSTQDSPIPIHEVLHTGQDGGTPIRSAGPALQQHHLRFLKPRRVWLPVLLLVATCLSTFWAGAMSWEPVLPWGNEATLMVRRTILSNAAQGVTYMLCVIAILFAHEMGHYIATQIYRIPASLPFFIPFPFAPFGTMGAVIGMQGHRANRREIFDIGIAGPLAGLLFAVPIVWMGISQLDLSQPGEGRFRYDLPLLVKWIYAFLHPDRPAVQYIYVNQINALFMAGWVGLLITGLNMLPVSQLDGGHVTYTLFGQKSRWIARVFVLSAITYMFVARVGIWMLMLILVFVIGLYHPPTADDNIKLGWPRVVLGLVSLLIPVLCFPPRGLTWVGP